VPVSHPWRVTEQARLGDSCRVPKVSVSHLGLLTLLFLAGGSVNLSRIF
jgi:hypothetical protein